MDSTTLTAIIQYRKRPIKVKIGSVENGKAEVHALRGEPFGFAWTHGGWAGCNSTKVPVTNLMDVRVDGMPVAEWKEFRSYDMV